MQSMLLNALVGAAIVFATTLITLWTGEGVATFSDVSPLQYGVAALGAALGALKDIQSRKATPPT